MKSAIWHPRHDIAKQNYILGTSKNQLRWLGDTQRVRSRSRTLPLNMICVSGDAFRTDHRTVTDWKKHFSWFDSTSEICFVLEALSSVNRYELFCLLNFLDTYFLTYQVFNLVKNRLQLFSLGKLIEMYICRNLNDASLVSRKPLPICRPSFSYVTHTRTHIIISLF